MDVRKPAKQMEMLWRGAQSFGDSADVFTSNFPTGACCAELRCCCFGHPLFPKHPQYIFMQCADYDVVDIHSNRQICPKIVFAPRMQTNGHIVVLTAWGFIALTQLALGLDMPSSAKHFTPSVFDTCQAA